MPDDRTSAPHAAYMLTVFSGAQQALKAHRRIRDEMNFARWELDQLHRQMPEIDAEILRLAKIRESRSQRVTDLTRRWDGLEAELHGDA